MKAENKINEYLEVDNVIKIDVIKAFKAKTKVPTSKALDSKSETKKLIKLKLGKEIKEGSPIRFVSIDEISNIFKTGRLPMGSDFEGNPGIAAQIINKDTIIVAYGPNDRICGAIIFKPTDIESFGHGMPNEVAIKPSVDVSNIRFIIGGVNKILNIDDLKKIHNKIVKMD